MFNSKQQILKSIGDIRFELNFKRKFCDRKDQVECFKRLNEAYHAYNLMIIEEKKQESGGDNDKELA